MSRAKIEIVCGEDLLLQRTIDVFCSCSCNVAALPDLLPSIIRQVVHGYSATVAQLLDAIDSEDIQNS